MNIFKKISVKWKSHKINKAVKKNNNKNRKPKTWKEVFDNIDKLYKGR